MSKNSRNQRIFSTFMDRLKSKGLPLNATVLSGNQSSMVDRLVKAGFERVSADTGETKLRWTPLLQGREVGG